MFAVIKTGGKQYLVQKGETLKIEKINVDKGKSVDFDALLVFDEEGNELKLGTPMLPNKVTGEVIEHGRAKKISVVKYKPKIRYKKRVGHRQPFTKVKITKLA